MKKLLLAIIVIAAGASMAVGAADRSNKTRVARDLSVFNALVKELQLNYVDTINSEKLMRTAIDAMLYQIDPYTEYFPVEDREELTSISSGQYGGIGAYIQHRNGTTIVSEPVYGAPAALAGVRHGDVILEVDGEDVTSFKEPDMVSKRLRGQPGTTVNVKVRRPYVEDSILRFDIMRKTISVNPLPYYGIDSTGVGYIRLTTFNEKSAGEVRDAVAEMKRDPALKGIVLDLRGNGGGLLESAVDILSFFVPKGTEVVRTKGRDAASEKVYKTTRSPIFPEIPIAVLIDGGSASAAEILAGAVQDLDRGVLVGSRSFGKGLVQSTRPLPFQGVLKVTVAKYYIPSGRLIQALDYSHRNEDGSVSRIPDSLTHEFKTLHGRIVRDGGGLAPDSVIDWGKVSRLVYNVVRDNWSFDYATRFAATHPTIAPASEFVITDEIYDDFKKSIDPARFKYDRVMEEGMKQLREIATEEGYMGDETTAAFDSLAKLLTHDLNRDLDTHRKDIEDYLGSEIVSRYYYDKGKSAYILPGDKALNAAREILESDKYDKILKRK